VGKDNKRWGWGIIDTYAGSQWYNKIAAEISQYKITLGKKGAAKYKLDLLLRIAWQ
jgi:hypothetical protein